MYVHDCLLLFLLLSLFLGFCSSLKFSAEAGYGLLGPFLAILAQYSFDFLDNSGISRIP
jgi:hypothetical protein